MGTFAETAIVDYRSSFANEGKQTSVFYFRLQQQTEVCQCCLPLGANKWKLPFSVSSVFCIHMLRICCLFNMYIYATVSNRKRITKAQAIFLNPFTVNSLCKCKFVVCPFVDEETK
jgi:hypothetical protein